ncbi:oxalate:formate antiporter [Elysia marginata]|uniref:Oxalate:formate antiporter n=1 Tax=Elysia marginata TaxID=1093978 RepID=A0AAV4EA69_9GAST|nr:oxalate:formate antiporter [Elysia marginata]
MARNCSEEKCMKYCSIVGAHFVTLPLSFVWVYGNLSAYTDSYFRYVCAPQCLHSVSQWTLGLCLAMVCPGTLITKTFADKVGHKRVGVAAAIILNAGIFASAWTVNFSVVWTTVLLGVVMGLMQGVTSAVALQYVSGWAPENAPLFMATTSGFATLCSMLQNQIVTAIVNPHNLKPDAMQGSRIFFSQQDVLARVPTALIVYGAVNLSFQCVGYLLLAPRAEISVPTKPTHQMGYRDPYGTHVQSKDITSHKSSEQSEINSDCLDSNKSNTTCKSGNTTTCESDIADKEDCFHSAETDERQKSLTPYQILKTRVFYALFMFGVATMHGLLLKGNYYKQFGLLYIHNDRYLTLVGTLVPVVASFSRFAVGAALNRCLITIKDVIISSLAVNSVLCAFWYIVPQVDAVLYMFLILGLAVVQSLFYMVLPVASLHVFGPAHFSTNYGLLLLSCTFTGLVSPVVTSAIMNTLHWFWLFGSASLLCLITLLLVVCTEIKPQHLSS